MQTRRLISVFFVFIFFIAFINSPAWAEPNVVGQAAILIDARTGKILYAKNADKPMPPASTTKILTAIITLEKCRLDDIVTAAKDATVVEPSAIGLKEGEKIPVENHLWGLLLKSANDSAVALADHISGSVSEFAKLMNRKAREWGATNSNFVNPNGLPDPNHYTTAHDLAVIAKHAMENPQFRKIVSTKVKTIPRDDDDAIKWLENHNKMLWQYEGATGIKTGYTREAKQCLAVSAERDGRELIAVILGSEGANIWSDGKTLLNYGFDNFVTIKQKDAGVTVKFMEVPDGTEQVSLVTEKEFFVTLPKGDPGDLTEKAVLNADIKAPITKNQVLGKLFFYSKGEELGSVNLLAGNDVAERSFPIAVDSESSSPMLVGSLLLGLFLAWNIWRLKCRRKKRRRVWHDRAIR